MDTVVSVINSFSDQFAPFHISINTTVSETDPNHLTTVFKSDKIENPILILSLSDDETSLTIQKPLTHGPSNALYNRITKSCTNYPLDKLYDFMEQLLSTLPTLRDHCVICGVLLDVMPDCYISCGVGECRFRAEELMLDNRVTEIVKRNPRVSDIMLRLAYNAMTSHRMKMVFEPFPYSLLKKDVKMTRGHLTAIEGTDINSYKDFDAVQAMATEMGKQIKQLVTTVNKTDSDKEVVNKIGFELYCFLRFVLISADCDIQPDSICGDKVQCYRVIHKVDKEEAYKKRIGTNTRYLYHGSASDCWYSIIRNGLKVTSGTKMMFHGQACGAGVYTAANYATSLGYSSGSPQILGVFEVSNDKKYYTSGHNSTVCVINNAEALILRYLIVHGKNVVPAQIDTVFASKLKGEKAVEAKMISAKATRRLIKEFEAMQKPDVVELGFVAQIREDDMTKWRIMMLRTGFDPKEKITKTMEKLGIDGVELEFNFPERYPFAPPFVRIVGPRFQYRTGHITIGGAICHELLSTKKWKPVCKVESLLVDIRCNILEGEGDIDLSKWKIPYSFKEAESDYVRVMNAHGWN